MDKIEWLNKQVEIADERAMYADCTDNIHTVFGRNREVAVTGLEELAKEAGELVRIGYEDEERLEKYFEYKGVKFQEIQRKNDQ